MAESKDTRTAKNDDAVQNTIDAVTESVNADNERGFHGVSVDPTPRENYTLAGVTSGKPTPETDEKAAETARAALR